MNGNKLITDLRYTADLFDAGDCSKEDAIVEMYRIADELADIEKRKVDSETERHGNATPRLVRVSLRIEYVCYDIPAMIDAAREAVVDDAFGMFKRDETIKCIYVEPATDATASDIPEFLLEAMASSSEGDNE